MGSRNAEPIAVNDFLGLFGCTADDSRWIRSADSDEYQTVIAYLVERSGGRLA